MQNGEPNQYTGLCNIYNGLDQMQRGRLMTAYFLVNAASLPVIFALEQLDYLKMLLSTIVLALHCAWLAAAHRNNNLLQVVGDKLGDLEQLDEGTKDADRVRFFSDMDITLMRVGRLARLGRLSPFAAGIAVWLAATAYYYAVLVRFTF